MGVSGEIYISSKRTRENEFNGFTGCIWNVSHAQIVVNTTDSVSRLDVDPTSADASSSGDCTGPGAATCNHSGVDGCPVVCESPVLFNPWFPRANTLCGSVVTVSASLQ